MALLHVRRNAVAYLALAVACCTGTAYAADKIAAGSVTTKALAKDAVTSPKIKKNAVKSVDVKDGSLKADDLAPGVVPGAGWVGGFSVPGGDPATAPDAPGITPKSFVLPHAGSLQVSASFEGIALVCPGGDRHVGLYVDGLPVPGSRSDLTGTPTPTTLLGVVDVAAGPHTVSYGYDCPAGAISGYDGVIDVYSLVLGG